MCGGGKKITLHIIVGVPSVLEAASLPRQTHLDNHLPLKSFFLRSTFVRITRLKIIAQNLITRTAMILEIG